MSLLPPGCMQQTGITSASAAMVCYCLPGPATRLYVTPLLCFWFVCCSQAQPLLHGTGGGGDKGVLRFAAGRIQAVQGPGQVGACERARRRKRACSCKRCTVRLSSTRVATRDSTGPPPAAPLCAFPGMHRCDVLCPVLLSRHQVTAVLAGALGGVPGRQQAAGPGDGRGAARGKAHLRLEPGAGDRRAAAAAARRVADLLGLCRGAFVRGLMWGCVGSPPPCGASCAPVQCCSTDLVVPGLTRCVVGCCPACGPDFGAGPRRHYRILHVGGRGAARA